jgi:hypothetical protein
MYSIVLLARKKLSRDHADNRLFLQRSKKQFAKRKTKFKNKNNCKTKTA